MAIPADRSLLYWQRFVVTQPEKPSRFVEAFSFGTTPESATAIVPLVLAGTKTATGSLLWAYEADDKPVPAVGDYWVVVDGDQAPRCVIRTTEIEVLPFDEVPERYAIDGGEEDRTLATWRPMYWSYIVSECQRIGREPSEQAPLVMEHFEVVYSQEPG